MRAIVESINASARLRDSAPELSIEGGHRIKCVHPERNTCLVRDDDNIDRKCRESVKRGKYAWQKLQLTHSVGIVRIHVDRAISIQEDRDSVMRDGQFWPISHFANAQVTRP